MTSSRKQHYTCDRCGRKSEVPIVNSSSWGNRPKGWAHLGDVNNHDKDVCESCVEAFEEWWDYGKRG